MRRSCVALAASALALCAALAGAASPAQAFSGGGDSPITKAANAAKVKALLRRIDLNPTAVPGTTAAEVETGMTVAEAAATTLPSFATVGIWTVSSGVALYTGWKIGSPVGGYIYKRLTGDTYGGTQPTTFGPVKWRSICPSGCTATSWSLSGFPAYTGPGYILAAPSNSAYCFPATATNCGATTGDFRLMNDLANAVPQPYRKIDFTSGIGGSCNNGSAMTVGTCVQLVRTQAQMEKTAVSQTDNAAGYAAATDKVDSSAWAVPAAVTDDQLNAALQSLGALDNATGTAAQEAAIKAINAELTDTSLEVGTITLPDPEPDEDYISYLARLRALDWLGTATVTTTSTFPSGYTEYDPRYGPGSPVRIKLGSTGTWRYLPAAAWAGSPAVTAATWPDPANPPKVAPNQPVFIESNPLTFSGGAVPPLGGGGGSCGSGSVGALDITPITGLDYGDHFPFGVFSWGATQLGYFDVSAAAPAWSITIPAVGADYEIDLSPFDSYMSTMRTVLAWVLWIGAVWFVATSLLGVRGTGNPADAIDDYLDGVL